MEMKKRTVAGTLLLITAKNTLRLVAEMNAQYRLIRGKVDREPPVLFSSAFAFFCEQLVIAHRAGSRR